MRSERLTPHRASGAVHLNGQELVSKPVDNRSRASVGYSR